MWLFHPWLFHLPFQESCLPAYPVDDALLFTLLKPGEAS